MTDRRADPPPDSDQGPVVVAHGEVDDLDDEANILAVIATVEDVGSIDNRITVRGL